MRKLFYGSSILISFILWGFPCIFITFVSWQFSTSLSDSTCCVLQSKHIVVFEFLSHHHLSSKHNILNQCIKVLVSCFISQIMGNLYLRLNHLHTCKYCASQPGSAWVSLLGSYTFTTNKICVYKRGSYFCDSDLQVRK